MSVAVSENTAAQTELQDLDSVIAEYRALDSQRKALESEARRIEKRAKLLESAIRDKMESSGGELITDKFLCYFKEVDGVPSYKGICERYVAVAVLAAAVNATPKRKQLIIEVGI